MKRIFLITALLAVFFAVLQMPVFGQEDHSVKGDSASGFTDAAKMLAAWDNTARTLEDGLTLENFAEIVSKATVQAYGQELAVYAEEQDEAGVRITKSGTYDSETKTVNYNIYINGYGGTLTDVTLSDCPDFDTTLLKNSIQIQDLSLNTETWDSSREDVTDYKISESGSAEDHDLTYHITNLPDLSADTVQDTLSISYSVKVRDDLSYYETGENFYIGNTATVSAKASGRELQETTDCNVKVEQISGYKIAKETTDVIDGTSTPVLKWEAYIDKTKATRQDMRFTDTLVSHDEDPNVQNMAYDTNRSILVTAYRENGTTRQMYYRWNSRMVTTDGTSFSLTLPKDDNYKNYKLQYYTTYDTDEYDEGFYVNKMDVDVRPSRNEDYGSQVSTSGMYTKKQPPINVEASVKYDNDNTALDYHMNITVPGEIGQFSDNFWINCQMTARKDDEQISLSPDDLQWKTIKATLTNGQVIEFKPYQKGGSTENTYKIVPGIGDENAFLIAFNTDADDMDGSMWDILYGSQLEVDYSIPLTSMAADGKTIGDYLSEGYNIHNAIDAMAPFSMNWSSTETVYSDVVKESDNLGDFLTGLRIYDQNGKLLVGRDGTGEEHNETLYAGQGYNFEFAFAESAEKGESRQMKYDEHGYLTYKVPANLSVPVGIDHRQSILLKNGKKVGEFYFEDPYTCKVRFDDVDENGDPSDKNFIDGHINFMISFAGSFGNAEDGKIDLNLGDDAKITVEVENNAELAVEKEATQYDHLNRAISYTVNVTAKNGPVSDITLTDSMDAENRVSLLKDSVEVIHKTADGKEKTVRGVTVRQPDPEEEPYLYLLENLPDLEEGESLQIMYKGQLPEDHEGFQVASGKIKVSNSVQADGKNSAGLPITGTDSATAECTVTNLDKTGGMYDKLTDKDGNTIPAIRWTIAVGDGRESVRDVTLTDEMGAGLSLYQDEPLEVKWTDVNGKTGTLQIPWNDASVKLTAKGFTVKLPADRDYRKFRLAYLTTFDASQNGGSTMFKNTAKTTINGHEYTDTSEKNGVQIASIKPEKTGDYRQGSNGVNYIDYTIKVEVPQGLAGTSPFWIDDWLYRSGSPIDNEVQNVKVYTVDQQGERTDFEEYKDGLDAENTYTILTPKDNNSRRMWLFNADRSSINASGWLSNDKATLYVKYSVPTTAKATDGSKTMQDFLDDGDMIVNDAYVHQGTAQELKVQAKVKSNALLKKTGKDLGNGEVEYTVTLNNYDPDLQNDPKVTAADIDNLIFEDEFDNRMEYVDGSLQCQVLRAYDKNSVKYTCRYEGAAITGNKITARASDFIDKSDKNKPTLAYQIKHWSSAHKANYQFTYRLKLKDGEKKDAVTSSIQVSNKAHLTWDSTDGARADSTVDVKTGVLDKSIQGDLQKGNILQYQLELNPNASDLNPDSGADTLEVRDKLPDNLSVVWDKGSEKNITAKYEKNGSWIDFDSSDSEYTWTKSFYYDSTLGKTVIRFEVPDELHVKISYKCQVTETGSKVEISNTAEVVGVAQIEDINTSEFSVSKLTGIAESRVYSFFLSKSDSVTHDGMGDVTFDLYGMINPQYEEVPEGVDRSFVGTDGNTYYYYSSAVTGSDGIAHVQGTEKAKLVPAGSASGRYVLKERQAPAGYEKMEDMYFQFTEQPEEAKGGLTIYNEQFVPIVNVPVPATAGIEAEKTLNGKAPAGSEYTFQLYDNKGSLVETVQNQGGKIAFSDLSFSREGSWKYTIKEKAGTDADTSYDTSVYTAEVSVERNPSTGRLEAHVSYWDQDGRAVNGLPTFRNTKTEPPVPEPSDTGSLTVSKQVTGSAGETDREFTFKVKLDNDNISAVYGDMTFHNGEAKFKLKHGESKTAEGLPSGTKYTVTESDNDGYTVMKTGDTGTISKDTVAVAAFINQKDEAESVPAVIRAGKTLDGKVPSGSDFAFELRDEQGTVLQTVKNDGGEIRFTPLEYKECGTYRYTIREKAGSDAKITYDASVYTAVVTVTEDDAKNLVAEVSYQDGDGRALSGAPVFQNITKTSEDPSEPTDPSQPTKPDQPTQPSASDSGNETTTNTSQTETGDTSHPGWMILVATAALAGAVAAAGLWKKRRER